MFLQFAVTENQRKADKNIFGFFFPLSIVFRLETRLLDHFSDTDLTRYFSEIFILCCKNSSPLCSFGFKCATLSEIFFLWSLNITYKPSVSCKTVTAPDSSAQQCLETVLACLSSVDQIKGKFQNTTTSRMNK